MKLNKQEKLNSRLKYIIFGFFVLILLSGTLMYNLVSRSNQIKDWERYMIIGKDNIFAVYEDKLVVKIPFDINIDKDITFRDLIKVKNYNEIMNRINLILPEKINHYKVVKYGEVELDVRTSRNIPEVVVNNKRHILTSSTEEMFNKILRDKNGKKIANENIIVDILNANGIPGHARRTGEKISKDLGVKFNAANYEKNGEQSYIIINDLSKEKIEELVLLVNEKYLKIREDATIPTLANVILVLGKEQEKIFNVEVVGDSNTATKYSETLKKMGYNDVTRKKIHIEKADNFINYNAEDYYIAYKIGKKLGITKFVEKNSLKNKIEVVIE